MAGIILAKSSIVDKKAIDDAREKFKRKSFDLKEEKFLLGKYELYYYYDLFGDIEKVYNNDRGDCFFIVGTLIFESKTGVDALKVIEKRLDQGNKIENMSFSGSYILVIYSKEQLLISRDLFGGIDCYVNTSREWMTTNFLSAIALNKNNRISRNELLESILFGLVFGYRTIIEGINLLESTTVFNLSLNSSV